MSTLSLNWKKLSKRLAKDKPLDEGKNESKISVKSVPSKHAKTLKNTVSIPTVPNTPETVLMGPLEASLWMNENDILESNIIRERTKVPHTTGNSRKTEPGKYLAIDCEFVGVGEDGRESALARVSVVNFYGQVIYDKFVKPKEKVTDWRTWISGVTPKDLIGAVSFQEAQEEVSNLLLNKILVGHAVNNDLEALFLSHPKLLIRDTSQFPGFKEISQGKQPALKKLTSHFLNIAIQQGSHSSVDDARATMLLFRLKRKEIENQPRLKHHVKK
ncbi:exonuclease [Suhomyces tanzawaensis NRRL Y-17324]|uniref:RNA exonuclease 4 n=1 Tax=Suhomyces tanzawaensis NRRL Y-17324 TaxID=984487 RepID=A0A1E4SFK2_9ASCO|nr:exonuclease [Suhomyces tanzawaensis NRRL Y-17324]ODV78245.1 exonuclease [Suhomyces tanzawaensis NRRL Y-17324]